MPSDIRRCVGAPGEEKGRAIRFAEHGIQGVCLSVGDMHVGKLVEYAAYQKAVY